MSGFKMKRASEIILEKIRYGICQSVSKDFLEDMKIDFTEDVVYEQFKIVLRGLIWGRKLNDSQWTEVIDTVEYPSSIWNAIKIKLGLKGKTIKKSVNLTTHVSLYNVCPHIDLGKYPGKEVHLRYLEGETY